MASKRSTPYLDATFKIAAETGNTWVLKEMIREGANVNKESNDVTPLIAASFNGRHKCVELLIRAGADVNLAGGIAEISNHTLAELKLLFIFNSTRDRRVCQVNIGGFTPLSSASFRGHDECVKHLITARADVNKIDKWGLTPIFAASHGGHIECVKTLIQAGADVNTVCRVWAGTALSLALERGHLECAQILIEAKADVNHQNRHDKTPLQYAYEYIKSSHQGSFGLKSIRLLLRSGAEINRSSVVLSWIRIENANAAEQLLLAAGETRLINVPSHLRPKAENLMEHCREAIRKHLLELNPHENVFRRVPRLGLPAALQSFLLYDQTLHDDGRRRW